MEELHYQACNTLEYSMTNNSITTTKINSFFVLYSAMYLGLSFLVFFFSWIFKICRTEKEKFWNQQNRNLFVEQGTDERFATINVIEKELIQKCAEGNQPGIQSILHMIKAKMHYTMDEFYEAKENISKSRESHYFPELHPTLIILINLSIMINSYEQKLSGQLFNIENSQAEVVITTNLIDENHQTKFKILEKEIEEYFAKLKQYKDETSSELEICGYLEFVKSEKLRLKNLKEAMAVVTEKSQEPYKQSYHFFSNFPNIAQKIIFF